MVQCRRWRRPREIIYIKSMVLGSGEISHPGDIWECLKKFLVVTAWGEGVDTGISWVKASKGAEHLTTHSSATLNEELASPKYQQYSAEVENPVLDGKTLPISSLLSLKKNVSID